MSEYVVNYKETPLWIHGFDEMGGNGKDSERSFMKESYLMMREKVNQLLTKITIDMPEMTRHDISHCDALWNLASKAKGDSFDLNPTETFVFGASVLIHDAGMSLAAYENGISDLINTTFFKDRLAFEAKKRPEFEPLDFENPPQELVNIVLPRALRHFHADRAEHLTTKTWKSKDGEDKYLIENSNLRNFCGETIGKIAASHWFPVEKLENEFSNNLGAHSEIPSSSVCPLKLACLLRIADVLHIDSSRAPSLLYTLMDLGVDSKLHWKFQQHLQSPEFENESVVFSTGKAFEKENSGAWWLAYEMLQKINVELQRVNSLLKSKFSESLKAQYVRGVLAPDEVAKDIRTVGWQPVDINFHVSDIGLIVKRFGGVELYGSDLSVPIRELIQNAADAIQARRKIQNREDNWGHITIGLKSEGERHILFVEDNGIGMSKFVLTGPLLDFGKSFWKSEESICDLPGLLSSGMNSIGRFGIGFFSIFMLGSNVSVYTRKYNLDENSGLLLEFSDGTGVKPILSSCNKELIPIDGGTRIEVILEKNPYDEGGFLSSFEGTNRSLSLSKLVGLIAPCMDVQIKIEENENKFVISNSNDWTNVQPNILLERIRGFEYYRQLTLFETEQELNEIYSKLYDKYMQPIQDNDKIYGRAFISAVIEGEQESNCLIVGGLRAGTGMNFCGVMFGEIERIDRRTNKLNIPKIALANWATSQAELVSTNIKDMRCQAIVAEIVLNCGGEIGDLKIVRIGNYWYNQSELLEYLKEVNYLDLIYGEEVEYESEDGVSEEEFNDNFKLSDEIGMIIDYNGKIIYKKEIENITFNNDIRYKQSKIFEKVEQIMHEAWNGLYGHTIVRNKIGVVEKITQTEEEETDSTEEVEIHRDINVFMKDIK